MNTPDTPADAITNREEFTSALSRLIETAKANDVDISGGYRYDAAAGQQHYGIEIYRVAG